MIAAPLFHTWGFAHFAWSLTLGSTIVLQSRFDPEQTLAAVERHRADTLIVVPVMLQRLLELEPETLRRYDTSSLRVIAVSGRLCPANSPRGSWMPSAMCSTTCTDRPRSAGLRSPHRLNCALLRAPRGARRAALSVRTL